MRISIRPWKFFAVFAVPVGIVGIVGCGEDSESARGPSPARATTRDSSGRVVVSQDRGRLEGVDDQDDPAGLAISERMKSQIRALTVLNRNAADGISMVQVAEGGLDTVADILEAGAISLRTEDIVVQLSNAQVTNGIANIGNAIANVDITELEIN